MSHPDPDAQRIREAEQQSGVYDAPEDEPDDDLRDTLDWFER